MNKKSGFLIAATVLLLGLIAGGSLFFVFNNIKKERIALISKAVEYGRNQEYNKALELLEPFYAKNPDDSEIQELLLSIKSQKADFDQKEAFKAELAKELLNKSNNVFLSSMLKEFLQIKEELLRVDPENVKLKNILSTIEVKKSDLDKKMKVLINSLLNSKTETEVNELKDLINNLINETSKDFTKSQVDDALYLLAEILNADPNNEIANKLKDRLLTLKKEMESKAEREAIQKKVDELSKQLLSLLENNKFKEAEIIRKEILKIDPKDDNALRLEEIILEKEKEYILNNKITDLMDKIDRAMEKKQYSDAEEFRKEVLKLAPTNSTAIKLKDEISSRHISDLAKEAQKAISKEQYVEAEKIRKEILKINPKSDQAQKIKDDILKKKKEVQAAKDKEKENEIKKLLSDAKISYDSKKLLESEDKYNKVLLLDSNRIEALKGLADISILNSEKDPSEIPRAIRKILKVLDIEPNNLDYLVVLADLYQKSQNYPGELEVLDQILKITPTADFYVKAGVASYKLAKYDQSVIYLNKAIELDPNFPEIFYPFALTYEKMNDNKKRGDMLLKGVRLRPEHAATQYELGRFYSDAGDYENALEVFIKANDLNSGVVKYKRGVALTYLNLGQYDKSIELYENILKLDQTISEVYYNLSIARSKIGDYNKALTDISLAIKLKPGSPIYLYTIGEISEALGREDNAITFYLNALKLDNTYYKPMLNLGNIYDKFGRYEDGLKILKLAFALKPDDPGVIFSLGTSYLHNKMYEDSLVLLERSYNNDKNSKLKLFNLSLAYTEVGKKEKAEKGFKKIIEMDNKHIDAYFYLGQLLYTQDRKEEARTYFKKILEINPEHNYKQQILEFL